MMHYYYTYVYILKAKILLLILVQPFKSENPLWYITIQSIDSIQSSITFTKMSYLPFCPGISSKKMHITLIFFPPIWQFQFFPIFLVLGSFKDTGHTFCRMTFILSDHPDSSAVLTWGKFVPQGWSGLSGEISGLLKLEDGESRYWHFVVEVGMLPNIYNVGQPSVTKNYVVQMVNSPKVQKPCLAHYS